MVVSCTVSYFLMSWDITCL